METPLSLTEEQMRSLKEHGLCILVGTVQGTVVSNLDVGEEFYVTRGAGGYTCYVKVVAKQVNQEATPTLIICAPTVPPKGKLHPED